MPSIASLPNLSKHEVCKKIFAKPGNRLNQQDVVDTVQNVLDVIQEALAEGRNVEFRNFGVFQVVRRAAKPGRNPNKPDVVVQIPARTVVKFKTGKALRQQLAKLRVA